MSRIWTDEENAKLISLRERMGSMKELSTLIPGRTPTACITHATKIGLGARDHKLYATRYSYVDALVADLLKKTPGKTVREIAEITRTSYAGCYRAITTGHGPRYHICGWVRYRSTQKWTAKWALGEGEDVPKPRRLTDAEAKRRRGQFQKLKAQANNPFATAMNQVMQEIAA
jgi:hypothetical protein